jgi:hypothetical protein
MISRVLLLPNVTNVSFQLGIPTGSRSGSPYILRESTNPWIIQMSSDHIAFDDLNEAFHNVTEGNLVLYMSKQFLEFNVLTTMEERWS